MEYTVLSMMVIYIYNLVTLVSDIYNLFKKKYKEKKHE